MSDKTRVLYPLTSPQREIWVDQMLHDDVPLYNIGGYVQIPGSIDLELFEQAVNLLVQKHDTLRIMLTEEVDEDGVPMHIYAEKLEVTVPLRDFSADTDPHESATAWMRQRFVEPFELTGQPLFRYDLVKIREDSYYWVLQYHHLIIDGYGVALLNRSLAEIYTQLAAGETPDLAGPSYVSFIDNDRAYVESAVFDKQRQYWLDKYSVPPEPLLQPRYRSHYTDKLINSDCDALYLPRFFYNQLNELAKKHKATLFHVLLGALYVYFTRIAGRDDFAIGLPVLNRSKARFKKTAGLFTGVTPALFDFGRELSFAELLQRINTTLKANYRHQRFPISEINRELGMGQERSQLFDINLSYENHDYDASFDSINSRFTAMLHSWEQSPLMIFVRDFHSQADVKFDFAFNLAYFNTEDIKALQARFVTILEAVVKDSISPIHTLPVMTEQEMRQIQTWNDTATDFPKNQTIVDLFEQQVEKTPENIAVVFEEQELTYRALNRRANQVAHYLRTLGVEPEVLVGICVERSIEMVIGLLGILKAGGAYVPIDPSYPQARIAYMLEDSAVPVLLTQSHLKKQLPELRHACVAVCLDEVDFTVQETENPDVNRHVEDLAYVIYTSGSTGKPKGVMIEQKKLVNLSSWHINAFSVQSIDKATLFANSAFDASVWELWPYLIAGACVMPADLNTTIEKDIWHWLNKNKISLSFLPTPIIDNYSAPSVSNTTHLRLLLTGGDILHQCPDTLPCPLFNNYGPTENTVVTTSTLVKPNESPTIGKPIHNVRVYILDTQQQPQPLSIPGELCIAGAGLARGYLNRPELTTEKFIEIELFGKTERIYKTGDLARWRPDGNLEYLGRIDNQVNLRGFRIELGEIEAALSRHEAVKNAVVTLYAADDNKRLAAYITADAASKELIAEFKKQLKARLPEYMVPSHFRILDKLPLTPNGKIDRKALPAPDTFFADTQYEPPRNETEQSVADAWQQILKLENPSIHANFFESGGHSLLVIQVHNLLQKDYPFLKVVDLFSHPTIRALAEYLNQSGETARDQQLHRQRGEKRRTKRRVARQRKQ